MLTGRKASSNLPFTCKVGVGGGGGGDLDDFKFGTFIGRFPSDGAARVAVKGLICKDYWSLAM